ncbi:hypothetical protein M422DRAFT_47589 [Sphaerobolus stellatus SS14]|uniref:NADP-dependent oxidoreductase domain-containing protein n=1 Tax=Sphaerobolus stellatus (strain SS14) TaxID=990650 RepID=A0A0C9VYL7_SPHS4|nr:hypothetical protein M422DRAFT_47589 [Sphaerobolus stellatus SS14]
MSRVPLIFGTMTLGAPGQNGVRITELEECQRILDVYLKAGKEIDTARQYGNGTTEECLSKLDLTGGVIDTKVFPVQPGGHKAEAFRNTFKTSLEKLSPHKVRILYLHAPDRSVPFEETLSEAHKLHKEGLFEILGLSNYAAWEVAEIVMICRQNNWIQPTVYQGMYNAITRDCEPELIPCLRKFGMRFVIYNPLAGGFFAGRVSKPDEEIPEGRFSGDGNMARMYRARYFRSAYFEAMELIRPIAEKHGLRLTEIALRWCQHHSLLTPEDGVILGASSVSQLEQNINDRV